tara:strand:- start:212 stop:382 length:171 start_codon:yes stop_codon:yes gene_type:complete
VDNSKPNGFEHNDEQSSSSITTSRNKEKVVIWAQKYLQRWQDYSRTFMFVRTADKK